MSVETSKNRRHIQSGAIVTKDNNGIATYECRERHEGFPDQIYSTGSRKQMRKHLMKDLGFR